MPDRFRFFFPPEARVSRDVAAASPEWYTALRLDERAVLPSTPRPAPDDDARSLAELRLAAWREHLPDDAALAQRLAAVGLAPAALPALIAEPADSLRERCGEVPPWLSALLEAEAAYRDAPLDLPPGVAARRIAGFLELLRPQYAAARAEFARALAALEVPPALVSARTVEQAFAERLGQRWLWMIDRTLVLELHASAMLEPLPGATPEARFDAFVARLAHRDVSEEILREYPVLARAAIERAALEREALLACVRHLRDDADAIRRTFFAGRDPGPAVSLGRPAGDSHAGARVVRVIEFASGERLVYKPHALGIDVRFQALLAWLTERGLTPAPRTLAVLDRGTHGWAEFAAAAPCPDEAALERHVQRLGGLLAILHTLAAVDVHFENLIGAGEHPVCVDLETLLHPTPAWAAPQGSAEARLVAGVLDASVLRIGMLPTPGAGPDLSGAGSAAGQSSGAAVLQWEHEGRDDMHAVRREVTLASGDNRPRLRGAEIELADHLDAFNAGFTHACELLEHHRDALLAADGPLAGFAHETTRVVLRPTRTYGMLLEESWHPDLLRDALDRERFFDALWLHHESPALRAAIPHERADLWRGDVPAFTSTPASRVVTSTAGVALDGTVAVTGGELLQRRLAALEPGERERQRWLARAALSTRLLHRDDGEWLAYPLPEAPAADPTERHARCVAAALELGEWFDRMAHRQGEAVSWITLDFREQQWAISPSAEDVYAGVPGIAWFLATLADVANEPRFATLAAQAMRTLLRRLDGVSADEGGIGLFQGWSGPVHVLAHLAALQHERAWLAEAAPFLARIAARLDGDRDFDAVAGAAGAVVALLALNAAGGGEEPLALAVRAGDHLLAHAQAAPGGRAWTSRFAHGGPARGFAHGTAGIGATLAALALASGEPRFAACATDALAFEAAAHAERRAGGTVTLSTATAGIDHAVSMSWCHGVPGLALAHALAPAAARDAAWRGALEAHAREIESRGFGRNHCLCHGDLGNLDVLLAVAGALGDEALAARATATGDRVVASLAGGPWRCGTVGGVETPALMNGLAGIGHGLLRFAVPDRVPSVLALEPPRARA